MTEASITAAEALNVISSFFEHDWPQTKSEEVTVIKLCAGLSSILHLVTRSSSGQLEPRSVILRNMISTLDGAMTAQLSAGEQAVVFYEMSRRGWGPKLHGISRDYRVEEFIPSHHLTPEEAGDLAIRSHMARAYAGFHSLDLPLMKSRLDSWMDEVSGASRGMQSRKSELQQQILAIDHPDAAFVSEELFTINFSDTLDQIKQMAKDRGFRKALCHFCANYANVLVRSGDDPDSNHAPVLLIDYEMAMPGFAGLDLGAHFLCRMVRFDGDEKVTGFPYPSAEERSDFCQKYLQALTELGQELGPGDTAEQLMMQADMGALVYAAIFVNSWFKHAKTIAIVQSKPAFLKAIRLMMQTFLDLSRSIADT